MANRTLLPARVLEAFSESYSSYSTLGQIDTGFGAEGIWPIPLPQDSNVSGDRRRRVAEYYAGVDWTSVADVEQVLAAWTTHLDRLQLRDQTMEVERLIRILERSGLAYENGQIIWKEQPPQLHGGKATGTQSADELWEPDHFRLFLSHVSSFKEKTAQLRRELQKYQISGFVAHEDILPSREWQFELERALKSMDALAAILTQGYHESDWTDQEVGFALGRGVLVLSVRRDRDPYGFIARQQAVPGSSKKISEVARSIYQALELIP